MHTSTMGANTSGFELTSSAICELLSRSVREKFEEWIRSGDSVSIFLTGKTGSGKSALVNALVGKKVAEEGAEPDPMTSEVTCYEREVLGIRLKVWDSPGLQDGTGNEELYIADMKTKCVNIDLCLFCINVGDEIKFNRDSSEVKALVKLTEVFGPSVWDHAVIALTFANKLGQKNAEMMSAKRKKDDEKFKELFCSKISEWDDKLRGMLKSDIGLNPSQVKRLKIIPTGFRKHAGLPDRPHWLSAFWFSVLRSTHKRAQPALLRMNQNRIVECPDAVDKKDLEKLLEDQTLIFQQVGAEIGSSYGVPDIGSHVGLTIADMESCKLSERILLEQYVLHIICQEHSVADSLTATADVQPAKTETEPQQGRDGGEGTSPISTSSKSGALSDCSGIDEKGY